jgi:hypothetical protein
MIDWAVNRKVTIPPVSVHDEDAVTDWASIGRIYEHLACYYLSTVGFKAEIKDAAGYDILCECPDGKFFRVEVKSSTPRNYTGRVKQEINFSGLRNKARADVFMFFDRNTNHMVIKFADELDISGDYKSFTMLSFSDYHTQTSLAKLTSYVPGNELSYVSPSPDEALKLNRDWVLDNIDLVHQMKNKGIWQSTISKLFGIGDACWIKRISREDKNGVTDSIRRKNA